MAEEENKIYDYRLFNATDIKSFIINQMKSSENPVLKDVNYFGSNMNAFVDTIAVILQQLLFHLSLNTAETSFSSAQLYESMNRLSSILNYKPYGKQTSILPVKLTVRVPQAAGEVTGTRQLTIPKFLQVTHNSSYVLKGEITVPVGPEDSTVLLDAAMFQGTVHQSQVYDAAGDEFEKITLIDQYIAVSQNFISDNFFSVYVDESVDGSGEWREYSEVPLVFDCAEGERVYERRFTEDYNYEFNFGGETAGRKLRPGNRVVVFYLVSDGEPAVIGDGEVVMETSPTPYSNPLYTEITERTAAAGDFTIDGNSILGGITVSNTGPSTEVAYPESVESIRANAPKAFAAAGRLSTLGDYKRHLSTRFSSYCRDVYIMDNREFTADFLSYYTGLGIDRPQGESRLALSQVNFATACDFSNIYAVVLPRVNTVVSWKVPNFLDSALKREMVDSVEPFKGITHNLVPIDPVYMAFTWGSPYLDDTDWNPNQLQNRLVLTRAANSRVSPSYIRERAVEAITGYFNSLSLGDPVDFNALSSALGAIGGVKSLRIRDLNGNEIPRITLYRWNPLYNQEDNEVMEQAAPVSPFTYCYFYDRDNVAETILIEDE